MRRVQKFPLPEGVTFLLNTKPLDLYVVPVTAIEELGGGQVNLDTSARPLHCFAAVMLYFNGRGFELIWGRRVLAKAKLLRSRTVYAHVTLEPDPDERRQMAERFVDAEGKFEAERQPKGTEIATVDLFSALFRDISPGTEGIEVARPEPTLDGRLAASLLNEAADVVKWLRELDQQPPDMRDASFSVTPRQDTEEKMGQTVAVVAAHVHVHDAHPDQFLEHRPLGVPHPSALIVSERVVSGLWFLHQPLRDPADWPMIEQINRRLARAFGIRTPKLAATIEQRLALPRGYCTRSDDRGPIPAMVREAFQPYLRYDPGAFFVEPEAVRRRDTRGRG